MDNATLDRFEKQFGSPGRALSRLIRPSIAAPEGRTMVWGDWSAIEARVLPWLAGTRGAQKVLDVFTATDADPDQADIYCREAANIEGITPEEVWEAYKAGEPNGRQTGKVAILSLGFGGAVGALQAMATGYGISLTESEARVIVDAWRANNRWARAYWDALWEAFQSAMDNPDTPFPVGQVVYLYDKDYMNGTVMCFLPDGRPLVYPTVKWQKREVEQYDGTIVEKTQLTYRRGNERRALWYGVLAENNTQAVAGSLLRHVLNVLEPAPALEYGSEEVQRVLEPDTFVCGHTHDEIVLECDDDKDSVAYAKEDLQSEMERGTDWSIGLPLAAEVSENWFYTKQKL